MVKFSECLIFMILRDLFAFPVPDRKILDKFFLLAIILIQLSRLSNWKDADLNLTLQCIACLVCFEIKLKVIV